MDTSKNTFVLFLVGVLMLVTGMFWLFNIVQVTSTFGQGFGMWGRTVPAGIISLPLLAGICWWFFNPKSLWPKILTALGLLLILLGILMSIRFHIVRVSLFEFLAVFFLIAGGVGLVARCLLGSGKKKDKE